MELGSFLHHANTDRLIALWQAMNPTSFMTPDVETEGSYTVAIGENITENTPLSPFFMADGKTTWTSKSARYLKDFGYAYAELEDVSAVSDLKEKREWGIEREK
jgi:tyrosinase